MGKARDYIPALKFGHKIYPEDIAGVIGKPVVGNVFYVDAVSGSDTTNNGKSWKKAYATVGKAYTSCTNNNYDVIVVAPSGNTATVESSIVWAKNHITVVGATAPVMVGQRARIGFGAAATSPCLSITGLGNSFVNVKLVVEEDVNVMVDLSGERNYFENVEFAGICNATTGADTAARCLTITESGENYFKGCKFGVDTVLRNAVNYSVELIGASSCARNTFEDCMFTVCTSDAGVLHVKFTGAYSSECWTLFRRCFFLNTRGGTTTLTTSISTPASVNGKIIMDDSWWLGSTNFGTNVANIYVNAAVVDAADAGVLIVAAD